MSGSCRPNPIVFRHRWLGIGATVALLLMSSGCQSTSSSGSKVHWPWAKKTATVPAAPPGAFPPPGAPAGGGDPFLPPVAPNVEELPPPGYGSKRPSTIPDSIVRMGAPTPISLVSGTETRGSLARAFSRAKPLEQDSFLAVDAPRRPFQYIILHHSHTPNGNLEEIERRERALFGWNECGYHFVVGNGRGATDGQIEASSRWREQKHGAHMTGEATSEQNLYGIGICMIGDFNETAPTSKQLEATRELIAELARVYGIPAYRVLTHSEVTGDDHHGAVCPGRLFRIETVLPTQ